MVILLKNDEFPKISIKCYSKCFIIEDNEVYSALFIFTYIIMPIYNHFLLYNYISIQ